MYGLPASTGASYVIEVVAREVFAPFALSTLVIPLIVRFLPIGALNIWERVEAPVHLLSEFVTLFCLTFFNVLHDVTQDEKAGISTYATTV